MSTEDRLTALGASIKEVVEEIKVVSNELALILEKLDGKKSTEQPRAELLEEKTRLSKREELLRSKEDRLLVQKQELLRQQTFSLSLRERGAPPFLIFLK